MNSKRKNKGLFILGAAALVLVLVFSGSFILFSKLLQTETYYVLNQDLPNRTQITPTMLSPVVTQKDTAPKNALSIGDVQEGNLFTQYPVAAGDILTRSNVSGFEDISVGVPDSWVVTSFQVSADNAVGGRIHRGTYFDVLVVGQDGAFYPFVNMLALDATVNTGSLSSAQAVEGQEAHNGQTSEYTVGLPPAKAALLQDLLVNNKGQVKLVLSPRANEYQKPDIAAYEGLFSYGKDVTKMSTAPWNAGEDTDYTFSHVKRDKMGRPVGKVATCSEGNAKIQGAACKEASKQGNEEGKSAPDKSATDKSSTATGETGADGSND